MKLKNAALYYY